MPKSKIFISHDKAHNGVPLFFRALIWEAKHGGDQGYRMVGKRFARTLASEIPYSLDFDEWQGELDNLRQASPEIGAIWEWFKRNYPRAMTLIPKCRIEQFTRGVIDAIGDESASLAV